MADEPNQNSDQPEPTTRIKLLTSLAGIHFAGSRGDEVDWPESDAQRLIDAGYAVPVDAPAPKDGKKA